MDIITTVITGIIALLAGIGLGKLIFAKNTRRKIEEAEFQSQQLLSDAQSKAETLKKEKILEAKEKFVQLKAEYDKEVLERNRKINDSENRIKQKEISINQKDAAIERQIKENEAIKENLNRQLDVVAQKRNQLEKHQEEHIKRLEKIAGLTAEEAKSQLIESLKQEAQTQALQLQQEVIVEDTPEAIVLSSFDPLRREIARLSLQRLVSDGRIHPARIEEVVEKTRKQLEEQVMEIGERAVIELGIHGLHKELVRIVGKMRFRSCYGQKLLMHSREVANLCGVMAAELGLSPKLAKRAGLLHDIGKVPDEETELSHALLGAKLAEKFGENPAVINAIGAHHDEMEMQYIISPIIQSCDAISGAKPGARREIMQQYLQRIKDLENLAMNYTGVEKAYAIQAGRELRVIVEAEKVTDADSDRLSFEIAQKIQNEMTFPGQIKVTVIREKRAVNVAR